MKPICLKIKFMALPFKTQARILRVLTNNFAAAGI
jgi:hypothetical protein